MAQSTQDSAMSSPTDTLNEVQPDYERAAKLIALAELEKIRLQFISTPNMPIPTGGLAVFGLWLEERREALREELGA